MVLTKQGSILKLSTEKRASLELILAGFFWGFGFIGTVWALKDLAPAAIIFYRFFGAFLVTAIYLLWAKIDFKIIMHEFRLSVGAGFWLAATLLPQTWGLKYTTATNSAFITILYVLIVPLLATSFQKVPLPRSHWLLTLAALAGVAMMVQLQSLTMNWGDLLTLFCALMAAFHILFVEKVAPKSLNMFILNGFQALWCALFTLPLLYFGGSWDLFAISNQAFWGMIALTFGSSLLAFYLQFRAQKFVSASTASLLFLLESPFSALLAYFLLSERLTPLQMLGGVIIFISCALALRLSPSKST